MKCVVLDFFFLFLGGRGGTSKVTLKIIVIKMFP